MFLYPTHPTAAPMHHEPLCKPFNFSYTAIINVLGLPATACPLGLNKQGLPIGIQVRVSVRYFCARLKEVSLYFLKIIYF